MRPDTIPFVLWIASIVLSFLCLAVFVRHRREWPSLTALISFEILLSAALLLVIHHYAWYFYIFWFGSAVQSALRLWVMLDCLRSMPGASFIPNRARLLILTIALILAIGTGIVAWGDGGWVLQLARPGRFILHAVLLYNQSVSFACLALLVGVLAGVFVLGLGWDTTGARIACGLGLQFAESAFRSALFVHFGHHLRVATDVQKGLVEIFVLLIWVVALTPPPTRKAELSNL